MPDARHAFKGDEVRAALAVALPPVEAFELFTTEIDRWWRRGPKFRQAGIRAGVVHIEPRVHGRVFESIDDVQGARVFDIGSIAVWEPPNRLVFSWRNANFGPAEITEVEVRFRADRGTIVEVTHRGWASIPIDRPARHGLTVAAFVRMMGFWWGDQISEATGRQVLGYPIPLCV